MESIKKFKLSFTQVPNVVLKDRRLSLKAKGLYAYLFSKPDGWQFNPKIIIKEIKEGRDAFYAAMKELVDCGYICRHQPNAGKFGSSVYRFVDPTKVKACAEKPYTEKPYTENPYADTNITNTELTNTENNNINNINNINKNTMRACACDETPIKTVDMGGKILIGDDFSLNFEDEVFKQYCLAKGELSEAVKWWLIKNKRGQAVDKHFICKQIVNFATRQGKIKELLG